MEEQALREYHRRTLAADALIASSYLAGTNTRRERRALSALLLAPSARTRWPGVAQGEEQLGHVECPLTGRGADHAIERSNAGWLEVDHLGDYATLNSYQSRDGTVFMRNLD